MSLQQAIVKAGLLVEINADVRDGSLIYLREPNTGTQWEEIPETVRRAGRFYQAVYRTSVPADHPILNNLPGNCWIAD